MRHRRSGFTLVELLVVIAIIMTLATLVFMAFSGRNTDRTRSAARIAQSAFLGAKDRALHAKDLRGIRLTRDLTDNTLVNGFVYLQPLPIITAGNTLVNPTANNVSVTDPLGGTDYRTVTIAGPAGATWLTQDQSFVWPSAGVRVRIASGSSAAAGSWYNLQKQNASAPFWNKNDTNGNDTLILQTVVTGGPILNTATNASIDVQLGNDVLPFHQPIPLSSNVVIDLKFCGGSVPSMVAQAGGGPIDVMFSPRGNVSGYLSGLGPMHFLLRDLKDATATSQIKDANGNFCGGLLIGACPTAVPAQTEDPNKGDRLILSVFPQTGLVQVFEIDPTDIINNATLAAGPDGLADNLFYFAVNGKSAGR